ncbi:MAG: hypothetical protein M1834_003841 [Cirrosporium novae-zelandiae]|nr:MAG: hypothetical protein M1834_003841 [Cirrosporium novae-zelandiae]
MESSGVVVGGGANGQSSVSSAYGSPVSARMGGRKRDSLTAGLDESPESYDGRDIEEIHEAKRRLPGVKRACNECRQQKLRCDVVQDPFTDCSRCRRLKLECKIETNFKRVGKRSKNAEMEREIQELRARLQDLRTQLASQQAGSPVTPITPAISNGIPDMQTQLHHPMSQHYMGSHEAVAGLLDLKSGFNGPTSGPTDIMRTPNGGMIQLKRLDNNVALPDDRVNDLFHQFFTFYHPYLPFLDPNKTADEYFNTSTLLFWCIISVGARRYTNDPSLLDNLSRPVTRLVWLTLSEVPQSYHIVKALCLLCTWPFPVSSTSADPTFMLNGLMMHLAMQIGLHRPTHAQDFSKVRVELREEEVRDRVRTWAVCNIVAQRVATGYGQPPCTLIDQTLAECPDDPNFRLPEELDTMLRIEDFVNYVTQSFYCNRHGPEGLGLLRNEAMGSMISILSVNSNPLEKELGVKDLGINHLYYQASQLHLRLGVLFDSFESTTYMQDLLALYSAATSFLDTAFQIDTTTETPLAYTTNYILQMFLAAGFALHKLLNSAFATHVDAMQGRNLFSRTIAAIRSISVMNNDLPQRLAEVLAQLWSGAGSGVRNQFTIDSAMDNSLRLKVRCRMSMSLLYDSVWRWREDFQAKGANLESSLKNPTNPDSTVVSTADTSITDPALAMVSINGPAVPVNSFTDNYEVFDPLNWMLDGFLDFPYSYQAMQGLDTSGIH